MQEFDEDPNPSETERPSPSDTGNPEPAESEKPDGSNENKIPHTGDNVMLFAVLILMIAAGMTLSLIKRIKCQEDN